MINFSKQNKQKTSSSLFNNEQKPILLLLLLRYSEVIGKQFPVYARALNHYLVNAFVVRSAAGVAAWRQRLMPLIKGLTVNGDFLK